MSNRRTPRQAQRSGEEPPASRYPAWVQAVALLLVALLVFWAVASVF